MMNLVCILRQKLLRKLPLAHKLYLDTVAKVIGPPDKNLLNKWYKFK